MGCQSAHNWLVRLSARPRCSRSRTRWNRRSHLGWLERGPANNSTTPTTEGNRHLGADFEGKVAIVTGAAGGINRVILTRLAEERASCILVDVNDDWGESSAAALRDRGLEVTYIRTDVRVSVQVKALVARAIQR